MAWTRLGRGIGPLVAASIALGPAAATGAEVRFDFEGEIVATFGSIGGTPVSAFVGAPITGYVVFDSEAADTLPALPDDGVYAMPVPPNALHAQIGGAVFDGPSFTMAVANDSVVFSGADLLSLDSNTAFPYPGVAGYHVSTFGLTFFDGAGAVFTSDALPLVPPSLAHFTDPGDSRSLNVQGCADANFSGGACSVLDFTLQGDISSLTLPEPSSSAGAALAALAVAAAARSMKGRSSLLRGVSASAGANGPSGAT